ncbi:hypothetical protein [uncultured Sulfitobacter sp.]|uniref:hypothetical protein n=1 Tax=uncultured Sulfitobacter sp. TaxID=191468 RepID=UPI0030FBDB82
MTQMSGFGCSCGESKMRDRSSVRKMAGVREDISAGGTLEVECIEGAQKDKGVWRGLWRLFVCTQADDGAPLRALVVVAGDASPKYIVTVSGLVSLAVELGFNVVNIPLAAGQKEVWEIAEDHR